LKGGDIMRDLFLEATKYATKQTATTVTKKLVIIPSGSLVATVFLFAFMIRK
jgi:hypothetical protein